MKHLHKYNPIFETGEVTLEVCEICKKRLYTRKDKNGRIDNELYRKEHKRDFLQPWEKEFKKYYN
jgi:hypothetical protein